ncbi:MAG: M28 family peptidase [Planctomycetota bacterium]
MTEVSGSPIADALATVDEHVRTYDVHISTLAGPYMQGRVPGSDGMERAKDYVQFYFEKFGFLPAFPNEASEAFTTFRDPFSLGGSWSVISESLSATGSRGDLTFKAGEDFVLTGLGESGEIKGEAVFVGYGIEDGPNGYSNFDAETDLTGKVAVMFRFEPMDEEGRSLWNEGRGWSDAAGFANKLDAVGKRNPAAVIIINPPEASDPRAARLGRFGGGSPRLDVPVVMMTPEAGEWLARSADDGRDLMQLRRAADEGGVKPMDLGVTIDLKGEASNESLIAENVGGYLPGKGELADEWIVVGAHLDHLGLGLFGSRTGSAGTLHPGADDNASGSAGLVLLAEMLQETFADADADADGDRRSIVLIAFSGEESGLNGSRHYVQDPIVPIEDHTLMINWDMIGRIENERVLMSGTHTGQGLREYATTFADSSGLDVQITDTMSGASDHTPFFRAGVPVLFSIIADFHQDYHTPADEVWKINRVGAVKTVKMYHDLIADYAFRAERIEFATGDGDSGDAAPSMPAIRVRLGVMPSYNEEEAGIGVESVSAGGPAEAAGFEAGDRIVRWDGRKVEDIESWMRLLARHDPGDKVNVGVLRDGNEETIEVELSGR